VRSGLLSDVELYEGYPSSYVSDVQRRHRWIRGDWQIAHWLLPRVPGADGVYVKNPLSVAVALESAGQPAPQPGSRCADAAHAAWAGSCCRAMAMDPGRARGDVRSGAWRECVRPDAQTQGVRCWGIIWGTTMQVAGRRFASALFALACLPYEAFYCLDAIMRTGVRMLLTRRNLLQWTASSEVDRQARSSLLAFVPVDVGRAGAGDRHCGLPAAGATAGTRDRRTTPAVVAGGAAARVVVEPSDSARRRNADRRGRRLPAQDSAPHLGVLRTSRHRRKTTGCRRTMCRNTRQW
jgi:hypothetical protein